jgi:hypothetical protein
MKSSVYFGGILFLASCAAPIEQQTSFVPSASVYSASFSESGKSFSIPAHEPIVADVVVRPDFFAMNFAVRTSGKTSDEALAKAKEEVDAIGKKVSAIAGNETTVRPCGFRSEQLSESSSKAIVDGVVEVPLNTSTDYWARAGMMSKIDALVSPPAKPEKAATGEEDISYVGLSAPRFLVRDAEKYRAELMTKWVARAKAFSEAAGGGLRFVRCETPGAITQSPISFEELALSLRMACQLDAGT